MTVVRTDFLAQAEAFDAAGKTGYRFVPESAAKVAHWLDQARQAKQPLSVYREDASRLDTPVWLDLSGLKQVRKYNPADLVITVETGITWGELTGTLAKEGHGLPLTYPDEMLLADILAGDLAAPEAGFAGYPRDYVLGLEVATADGAMTKCGGEVVKNVTGYDLNKLYVGSHHTLAVMTAASLKLAVRPETDHTLVYPVNGWERADQLVDSILAARLPLSVCRVSTTDGNVAVTVRVSGAEAMVSDARLRLEGFLDREPLAVSEKPSQSKPATALMVEVAVPAGESREVLGGIRQQPALKPEKIEWDPPAGLIMLSWEDVPGPAILPDALLQLAEKVRAAGGLVRLLRFPEAYGHLAQRLNLPEDKLQRQLSARLKTGYDPEGILHSATLPLHAL